MTKHVNIIGGGLAGTEAAHQLAKRGISVTLHEMRPQVDTSVHSGGGLAQLVCSNSLRSDDPLNPVGLLKREMAAWDSIIIRSAREASLPAGSALAVDRDRFSEIVTDYVESHPLITVVREEATELPSEGLNIVAAGPLCSKSLSESLYQFLGDSELYFYDAIAPVVELDSMDHEVVFFQSRYGKGGSDDYLNIPLDQEAYLRFHHEMVNAERTPIKAHEKLIYFEGCLPIEVMAERGVDTMRYGPMKPVGITDPRTDEQPYAVIQLRQDNFAKSLWNMVGFQTQLKWGEQKRIFQALPGMEKAKFVRYGMIHRNTFVNSPKHLSPTFQFRNRPELFLAGQITGVEGYVESAASGLQSGIHAARILAGEEPVAFPPTTALGALAHYVSFPDHHTFQPTNINFGIIADLPKQRRMRRREKRERYVQRALADLRQHAEDLGETLTDISEPAA